MISSFFIKPATVGAMFWRSVEHNALERTRPISGNGSGDGEGVAGTNSGVTAANKSVWITKPRIRRGGGYSGAGRVVSAAMPRDRFFVAGERAAGERIALASDDAHKLRTVLRRRTGDAVEIVDARGTAYRARLEVGADIVCATLEASVAEPGGAETAARIVLAQAVPKGQKMDFIVEKATELGVAAIVPLRSERVAGERTGAHKSERWQRIAKSAAQQAGRGRIPSIEPETGWAGLVASFTQFDRVYVAWEAAAAGPLRERFEAEARAATSVLVVIGPEGGFSAAEVAAAQAAGGIPVSLGPRVLRTETAALVVLAALLYARGEL
jgi:16S rRNA (uracil1498-N3)-methyltransferase